MSNFWGYRICQGIVHAITKFDAHFHLKSKREGTDNEFW